MLLALLIWQPWSKEQAPPVETNKPTLAVIYFKNNTGDESLDHWRRALSDLLISDLSQSKYMTILPEDMLYDILDELELLEVEDYSTKELKEVAVQGYVENILVGNYVKAGDNFRINASLRNIKSGESIRLESVEGIGEESFFAMVDELTKRIKTSLEFSPEKIANDIDETVGKITTNSLDAYKAYMESEKLGSEGKPTEANEKLEEAVILDPEFAMAYRKLAVVYSRLPGKKKEAERCLKKAFELSDRVSERERLNIQGSYYSQYSEKTWDKSIEAFTKLLKVYPVDRRGNNNLAATYMFLEDWDNCIKREKSLVRIKNNPSFNWNIMHAYKAKGMYEKAREINSLVPEKWNVYSNPYYQEAESYLCQGKYEQALSSVEEGIMAKTVNPIILYQLKGDIYHLKGNLVKAEEQYIKRDKGDQIAKFWAKERLGALYLHSGKFKKSEGQLKQGIIRAEEIEITQNLIDLHLALAYVFLKSGDTEKAMEECDKALNSAVEEELIRSQIRAQHIKGLIQLESSSIQAAKETAQEIKRIVKSWFNTKLMRYHLHLIGMIEFEKKNYPQAIEYFEEAMAFLSFQCTTDTDDSHALFIDPLGLAYYKSENLDKANAEYERLISLTTGRLHYSDIYAKSFYMLGKIYEQQGDTAKAIEHYQKFLELWKDSDPGISEVEDARERLAGLKGES